MSECKKAWKYLEGSEKDFEGAPDWASIAYDYIGQKFFTNGFGSGFKFIGPAGKEYSRSITVHNMHCHKIIAQREPVTAADVEVVKYDRDKIDIAKEFSPEGYPENGQINHKCGELKIDGEWHESTINKYTRDCKGVQVDVYDVLQAFDVTNPALQHLIKKALCVGIRGHKTKQQDLQDIIDSAIRAKELEQ